MGLLSWFTGRSELFAQMTQEEKRAALDLDDFLLQSVLDARKGKVRMSASNGVLQLTEKMTDQDIARAIEIVRWNKQAQQASARGDHTGAITCFEKIVAEAPFDSIALMSLGVQYAFLRNRSRAIEYLEKAVKADPGNRRIRDNLEAVRSDPSLR